MQASIDKLKASHEIMQASINELKTQHKIMKASNVTFKALHKALTSLPVGIHLSISSTCRCCAVCSIAHLPRCKLKTTEKSAF